MPFSRSLPELIFDAWVVCWWRKTLQSTIIILAQHLAAIMYIRYCCCRRKICVFAVSHCLVGSEDAGQDQCTMCKRATLFAVCKRFFLFVVGARMNCVQSDTSSRPSASPLEIGNQSVRFVFWAQILFGKSILCCPVWCLGEGRWKSCNWLPCVLDLRFLRYTWLWPYVDPRRATPLPI